MGGLEEVQHKLRTWTHAKEATYNPSYLQNEETLAALIECGKDLFGRPFEFKFVDIDDSFPAYLREHAERFAALIK